MSHTEAFGHLRSFVVGLEVKARELRKALEGSRDEDGNWKKANGGLGIGERCARAIGAASPEQVTKEMIAEVAEQDKLLRQAEDTVRTDTPIQEATEKYQALLEYNELALEDLEERLSAYGYVRPPRVTLDSTGKEEKAGADPPVVPSVARLPARGRAGREAADSNGNGGRGGSGAVTAVSCDASAEGAKAAGADTVASGDPSFSGQRQEQQQLEGSGRNEACGVEAAEAAGIVGGEDHGPDRNEEPSAATTGERGAESDVETAAAADEDEGVGVGGPAVTPARVAAASVAPAEPEEPGSPPTPASPGLADWEITEESRDMLRRAQPQQLLEKSEGGSVAAPRSLDALLAQHTGGPGVSSDPAAAAGATAESGGGGRRCSVSSDWSPAPPSAVKLGLSRSRGGGSSSSSSRRRGRDGLGTPETAVEGGVVTGMSAWRSACSTPPTPARMSFETEGRRVPGRETPEAAATESRDSSLRGSPSTASRSPFRDDATARLSKEAGICGKRQDASTPSSDNGGDSCQTTKTTPVNTKRNSPRGEEASSLAVSLPEGGPREKFLGSVSPASSVVASSREATSEQPAPTSPATPATPEMLSSRFRIDSAGGGHDDGGGGGGAASVGSSGPVTRPASRKIALIPEFAGSRGAFANSADKDVHSSGRGRGAVHNGNDGPNDGYDSDKCPTPELSSPLRSASISARDIRALTPSVARASGSSGGSSGGEDSDACPTPELSSPLRSAGSAALCRRRLEEEDGEGGDADEHGGDRGEEDGEEAAAAKGGPLELVSEEEYAKAPKFLTIQVSRNVLNDTIGNLNAYAAPRLGSPSELLLTVDEIMAIIDHGDLSRTLLLSVAHLKRVEMKGPRMYRIRT